MPDNKNVLIFNKDCGLFKYFASSECVNNRNSKPLPPFVLNAINKEEQVGEISVPLLPSLPQHHNSGNP